MMRVKDNINTQLYNLLLFCALSTISLVASDNNEQVEIDGQQNEEEVVNVEDSATMDLKMFGTRNKQLTRELLQQIRATNTQNFSERRPQLKEKLQQILDLNSGFCNHKIIQGFGLVSNGLAQLQANNPAPMNIMDKLNNGMTSVINMIDASPLKPIKDALVSIGTKIDLLWHSESFQRPKAYICLLLSIWGISYIIAKTLFILHILSFFVNSYFYLLLLAIVAVVFL